LIDSQSLYKYVGYENALALYRSQQQEKWNIVRKTLCIPKADFIKMLFLGTRHRYWMINWYTFALLSFICCISSYTLLGGIKTDLSLPFGIHETISARFLGAVTASFLVFICAIYTFWLVVSLTRGRSSYEACAQIWEQILDAEPETKAGN
jgi:hypothetical protein